MGHGLRFEDSQPLFAETEGKYNRGFGLTTANKNYAGQVEAATPAAHKACWECFLSTALTKRTMCIIQNDSAK